MDELIKTVKKERIQNGKQWSENTLLRRQASTDSTERIDLYRFLHNFNTTANMFNKDISLIINKEPLRCELEIEMNLEIILFSCGNVEKEVKNQI